VEVIEYSPDRWGDLADFLSRQFPTSPLKADRRYFEWRFGHSPFGPSYPSAYWLLVEGNDVIGQLGAIRDRLIVQGRVHSCVWLVDLVIAPEHRGGIGLLRLFQHAMSDHDLVLTLGARRGMARFYEALGWKTVATLRTAVLPIRPGRSSSFFLQQRDSALPVVRRATTTIAVPIDGALARLHRLRTATFLRLNSSIDVSPLARFDRETDDLIRDVSPTLGVATERSARQLHWKFLDRPVGEHFTLAARKRGSGELQGYVVVKMMERANFRWADLADILWRPEQEVILRALTAAAVREGVIRDADFFRIRLSSTEHLRQFRRPIWFSQTPTLTDEVLAYSSSPAMLEQLKAARWHLTPVVSDRADYGADER
jgi:hypothetical protein